LNSNADKLQVVVQTRITVRDLKWTAHKVTQGEAAVPGLLLLTCHLRHSQSQQRGLSARNDIINHQQQSVVC
jgi:hypothetical protein